MTTTGQQVSTNRFTDVFGLPKETTAAKVKDHLSPYVQEFIKASPFAVMATSGSDGQADASPKGGKPGFVKVLDERHLLFPDIAGNKLFQSYLNVDVNPKIGLVFFIPGLDDTVRVNGAVIIVSKEELERQNLEVALYELDDRSLHLQGMLVEVVEAYTHCPRALTFSHLWDTGNIQTNQETRPIMVKPATG